MRRAEKEARDEEALAPLLRVASEAGSGEVERAVHERGKARLLDALAASKPPARGWSRRAAAVAVAVACACALLFAWARPRSHLGLTVDGGASTLRFSDGSTIALAEGARARVADVSAHGARILLESGEARARIVHAPGTAWSIEAGPFTIAVTGTAFDVGWRADEGTLDVRMIEGVVVVRGPQAPEGVVLHAGQRLVAGGAEASLRIDTTAAPERSTSPTAEPAAPSASTKPPAAPVQDGPPQLAPSPSPSAAAAPVTMGGAPPNPPAPSSGAGSAAKPEPSAPPTWAQRVAAGDFAGVLAEADARGIDAALDGASLADLGALADAARYRGRFDLARRALVVERARFAGSREAANAAFLLGRIAEDAQGAPAAAVVLYDRYLAESPGGPFAEEALGRKMVSLRRSAGLAAARSVAEEYLRRYPQGAYAAAARELSRGMGQSPALPSGAPSSTQGP